MRWPGIAPSNHQIEPPRVVTPFVRKSCNRFSRRIGKSPYHAGNPQRRAELSAPPGGRFPASAAVSVRSGQTGNRMHSERPDLLGFHPIQGMRSRDAKSTSEIDVEAQKRKTTLLFRNSGIASAVAVVNASLLAWVNIDYPTRFFLLFFHIVLSNDVYAFFFFKLMKCRFCNVSFMQ